MKKSIIATAMLGALSPMSVLLSHKRVHVQIEEDEAHTNDRDYNKIVEEIAPECRGRLTRPVRRTMSLVACGGSQWGTGSVLSVHISM
jgi:hypothetical protein